MGLIQMEKSDIKDFQGFILRNLYRPEIKNDNEQGK